MLIVNLCYSANAQAHLRIFMGHSAVCKFRLAKKGIFISHSHVQHSLSFVSFLCKEYCFLVNPSAQLISTFVFTSQIEQSLFFLFEVSSFQPLSVTVQATFCWNCSITLKHYFFSMTPQLMTHHSSFAETLLDRVIL